MPSRPETPPEVDDGITDLQDTILGLLEDAGIPTAINDRVMILVRRGEALAAGEPVFDPVEDLRDAVAFFDRVKGSSQADKIAVGSDHWDRLEKAARKLVAELPKPPRPMIPTGVYWSPEAGNFYDVLTNKGMGLAFYEKWEDRKDEFPEKSTTSAGLDLNFDRTVQPRA